MSYRAKAKKDQSQTDLESPANTSRRAFLGTFSGVAAAAMAAGAIGLEPLIDTKSAVAHASDNDSGERAEQSFKIRLIARCLEADFEGMLCTLSTILESVQSSPSKSASRQRAMSGTSPHLSILPTVTKPCIRTESEISARGFPTTALA